MKIARVILTMECARQCEYCCNKYEGIMKQATDIPTFTPLKYHDIICLTGGEPMENPALLLKYIERIRGINPDCKLYLYTARYNVAMIQVIDKVDGVHYTLHKKLNIMDLIDFNKFQIVASKFPEKSFRLYIHPEIRHRIPVKPCVWSRVEVKPWHGEESCVLPENEELFIYK